MDIKDVRMNRLYEQPVARAVEMPKDWPYPTGAVSVYFDNMSLPGGLRVKQRLSTADGEHTRLQFQFMSAELTCDCVVETKPDPIIDIDTAGRLAVVQAQEPSPEKEQWLDQAREERTKLAQTPNGQKLLIEYGKHNEVFNEVFQDSAFSQVWKAGGVTEQMSRDTYSALESNAIINDKTYSKNSDGPEITYNYHAFYEQTALAMATLLIDPDYDPFSPEPAKPSKYTQASKAVLGFGRMVATTGNDKNTVTLMKPQAVYEQVDCFQGSDTLVDDIQLYEIPNYYANTMRGATDAIPGEDCYGLQGLFDAILSERAENSNIKGQALYNGLCSGVLSGDDFGAQVLIARADGKITDITVERFTMPDFELDIDDSAWQGAAADIARERVSDMTFLHNYLHRSIFDTLSSIIREVVAKDENFHIG